jgi:hypothetical protein
MGALFYLDKCTPVRRPANSRALPWEIARPAKSLSLSTRSAATLFDDVRISDVAHLSSSGRPSVALVFHQEHRPGSEEREQRLAHIAATLDEILRLVGTGT